MLTDGIEWLDRLGVWLLRRWHDVALVYQPQPVRWLPVLARFSTCFLHLIDRRISPQHNATLPLLPPAGVQATAEMFVRQLVRRMATRLAADLEPPPPSYGRPYRSALQPAAPAQVAPAFGMQPGAGRRYYD